MIAAHPLIPEQPWTPSFTAEALMQSARATATKAAGPDDWLGAKWVLLPEGFWTAFARLWARVVELGVTPDGWRRGRVVLIEKPVSGHRPLTILPGAWRIGARLLVAQLGDWIRQWSTHRTRWPGRSCWSTGLWISPRSVRVGVASATVVLFPAQCRKGQPDSMCACVAQNVISTILLHWSSFRGSTCMPAEILRTHGVVLSLEIHVSTHGLRAESVHGVGPQSLPVCLAGPVERQSLWCQCIETESQYGCVSWKGDIRKPRAWV